MTGWITWRGLGPPPHLSEALHDKVHDIEWRRLALMEGYARRALLDEGYDVGDLEWLVEHALLSWTLRTVAGRDLAIVWYVSDASVPQWALIHAWLSPPTLA